MDKIIMNPFDYRCETYESEKGFWKFVVSCGDPAVSLESGEAVFDLVPQFANLFRIFDESFSVGSRRYDGKCAGGADLLPESVGIVGFVGQHKVVVHQALQSACGAEAVVLVSANQFQGNRKTCKIYRHRKLGVSSAFGLPKLLILSWKRMLGRILVRLDVSRVEHHCNQKLFVPARELLKNPFPQSRTAPSVKASPDAVPFSEALGHLIPHGSGARNPPNAVQARVEVAIRAAATAAYLLPISVVNFFSSSRTSEGISEDLKFLTIN